MTGVVSVGIGGAGGKGGNGGEASLNLNTGASANDPGLIAATTFGLDSTAITVKSMGGGGSSGGFLINGALSFGIANGTGSIGIGGAGGDGGDGGIVSADITGAVMTKGDRSGGV